MKVVAIIQARLGSSRLPRKILQTIDGKSMLVHVFERARQIATLDDLLIACPLHDGETISDHLRASGHYGYKVACPSIQEQDVLARFSFAAEKCEADVIMRLTSDCPFLDPRVCEKVLASFLEESADYASNDTTCSGYPDGLDCEVFTRAALERAHREATDPYDREHVTPYIKRMPGARIVLVRNEQPGDLTKLSVDTPDDLARVRARAER